MKGRLGAKRFVLLLVVVLILYLSLYTWNLKKGVLDRLAANTGLEFTGYVLKPGDWVRQHAIDLWSGYVDLVGVREENVRLRDELQTQIMENVHLREQAARVPQLEALLSFPPLRHWRSEGARIIGQRLGPAGALETVLVDRGEEEGLSLDAPAVTPSGVLGRILRLSPHFSTVLLLDDPNSRVAVIGREHRAIAILAGQGPGEPLALLYVPVSSTLSVGEILVTSGLDGIFPKGLPVARVTKVEKPEVSLFQRAEAEPLTDARHVENVLLLSRVDADDQQNASEPAPRAPGSGADESVDDSDAQTSDQAVGPDQYVDGVEEAEPDAPAAAAPQKAGEQAKPGAKAKTEKDKTGKARKDKAEKAGQAKPRPRPSTEQKPQAKPATQVKTGPSDITTRPPKHARGTGN